MALVINKIDVSKGCFNFNSVIKFTTANCTININQSRHRRLAMVYVFVKVTGYIGLYGKTRENAAAASSCTVTKRKKKIRKKKKRELNVKRVISVSDR